MQKILSMYMHAFIKTMNIPAQNILPHAMRQARRTMGHRSSLNLAKLPEKDISAK